MFSEQFPLSESLGIFLGISSIEWLAKGYAEPVKAIAITATVSFGIYAYRTWTKKVASKDVTDRRHPPAT